MSASVGRVVGVAIVLTVVLATQTLAQGSTGFRVVLPAWPQKTGTMFTPAVATPTTAAPTTPATGNTTGLVLTLDTTWLDGNGYRPVRITITPTAPTTADRSLRVSFRPGNNTMAVTRDIDLPAGFRSVTSTLSVPQISPWHLVAFDVFEDGEHVRELSIPQTSLGMGWSQFSGDNASPAMLVLNTTTNSSLMLNAVGHSGQPVLQVGQSTSLSTSSTYIPGKPPRQLVSSMSNTIPTIADLPTRWIDYSMLDVIVASRQELQTLVEQHPAQWRAIRKWILAGGNLWVYDVGDVRPQVNWSQWQASLDQPWAHVEDVNKRLEFAPAEEKSPWEETAPALRGWNAPDPNAQLDLPNQYMYGAQTFIGPGGQMMTSPPSAVQTFSPQSQFALNDAKFPFALRPLGRGMVVAIPDGDPSNNPQFPWDLVFGSLGDRWHWSTRHGVNFTSQNDHYWNFLIPGVGAAPVTAFQVMITLFVLAIGPLNFYVLRRWHKLNLLLITVPASAAVVTVALLVYAVFSDGFGVRARTRSFTELNQQTGEATCVGRITYYAGLAPAKGLSFSGDITVYPLSDAPINTPFDSGVTRRLAWEFEGDDDAVGMQRLESGWLQSRVQTQLVTVRSRKTNARLAIRSQGDRASSVTNELGVPVSLLIVRDAAGEYGVARDLAAGATAELAEVDKGNSEYELVVLSREAALRPPNGVELGGSQPIFHIRRRHYGRRFTNMGIPMGLMSETSMLERSLSDALRQASLYELPPRRYVAIVERSPEFELGLDGVEDESSFHVIYGRW